MQISCIYKELTDDQGEVKAIEIIELESNHNLANKYIKLYALQVPVPDKGKTRYRNQLTELI